MIAQTKGRLAQSGRALPYKEVTGSNPVAPTRVFVNNSVKRHHA